MSLVMQRPCRALLEEAAANLTVYALLRRAVGRSVAFEKWCEVMELDDQQRAQLSHVRISLLEEMFHGRMDYDDIDWSGHDEERRASSTGTVWVDSMEGWFE